MVQSEPPFPSVATVRDGLFTTATYAYLGLTIRDYFAAAALTGLVGSARVTNLDGKPVASPEQYAVAAYCHADAMLAARAATGRERGVT